MVAARSVVLAWLAVLAGPGCGGQRDDAGSGRAPAPHPPPAAADAPGSAPGSPEEGSEPAPAPPPEFPRETRSLELVRTASVRLEPGDDAKRIGTIAVDTRVGWIRTAHGKGCQRSWVEMRPHGWICADYVRPSTKPPLGREVPALDRGEVVPGVYGKVTAPSSVTYTLEKPEKKKKRTERKGPITSTRQVEDEAPPAAPRLVEGKPLVGSVNV